MLGWGQEKGHEGVTIITGYRSRVEVGPNRKKIFYCKWRVFMLVTSEQYAYILIFITPLATKMVMCWTLTIYISDIGYYVGLPSHVTA